MSSCCTKATLSETEKTLSSVQQYYGQVLETTKDLKTSACTAAGAPHPEIRKIIRTVPKTVLEKFYGCGAPLPLGIEGLRVLDLGSGSGRDCYICSKLVGETGMPRRCGHPSVLRQVPRASHHATGARSKVGATDTVVPDHILSPVWIPPASGIPCIGVVEVCAATVTTRLHG